MKKIIIMIVIVLMSLSVFVYADDSQPYTAIVPSMGAISQWVVNYIDTYNKKGIYVAVEDVFETGKTPDEIIATTLNNMDTNPANLVAALYCAGVPSEDIRLGTESNGLSEMILVAGFETSKTVCGDAVDDTQAYTPIGSAFAGVPGGGDGGRTYGSPSGFPQ